MSTADISQTWLMMCIINTTGLVEISHGSLRIAQVSRTTIEIIHCRIDHCGIDHCGIVHDGCDKDDDYVTVRLSNCLHYNTTGK